MEEQTQFDHLEIEGDSWYECGFNYGRLACCKIKKAIAEYNRLFGETTPGLGVKIANDSARLIPFLEREMPEEMEEAYGIADGAGVSICSIMMLNCRYELTKFYCECTTAAILSEAGKNGKQYLCKNWDYRIGIMEHIITMHITQPDTKEIIGVTEAGQLVRDGMNSFGIAIVNNSLRSIKDTNAEEWIPTCFIRRKALKSQSIDELADLFKNFKRSVSCNTMASSGKNTAIDFEVHPEGTDFLFPENGILTHANHFVACPELNTFVPTPRDCRLYDLLNKRHSDIDADYIKFCLSDHTNMPYSICRHPIDISMRRGLRDITVASEIYNLSDKTVSFCYGPPCQNEYVTYSF